MIQAPVLKRNKGMCKSHSVFKIHSFTKHVLPFLSLSYTSCTHITLKIWGFGPW